MSFHDLRHFLLIISTFLFMGGCASLPPNIDTPKTYAFQDTADTFLGRGYANLRPESSSDSGFILLGNGLDAFTARVELAKKAEKSIDAQYYMIHQDLVGTLFGEQLINAADRGVRVRLLIDDMDLEDRDEGLSTLAFHPNISIRIFNPFSRNKSRTSQFITGFGSVTRRMHNKSFTVDNQVTIVGGRNIGNEYFAADPELVFADLDILAVGPVVKEASASFDEYWNSNKAYPIEILHSERAARKSAEEGRQKLTEYLALESVKEYKQKLKISKLSNDIRNNSVTFYRGEASILSDHPDKLNSYKTDHALTLVSQLDSYMENLNEELLIFSPYFVPGKEGTKFLCDLSKKGVQVRILTNSFSSTDVGIVHAGYAKYRTTLLRAGVELYEMSNVFNEELLQNRKWLSGSSKASLHAKSFVIDKELVFIGSLNLDPRSVKENTEIGIMVNSKKLADTMRERFNIVIDKMAFRLELEKDDEGLEFITWYWMNNGKKLTFITDPHTSCWQRFAVFIMGLLPIESQL